MRLKKVLPLALAGVLLHAGQPFAAETTTLDPVVVTATRFAQPLSTVPAATTVITAEEIVSSGARNLGEVLRDVVSLDVSSRGTQGALATPSIRGSSGEQVLVLLDGMRLNSQQNGIFDLNTLPISLKEIERIEIVRGPASALYGSSAVGGVIQIITKRPEATPFTNLTWTEGSYNSRNLGLSHGWQVGPAYYRIGASVDRSDGYRSNTDLNKETFSGLLGFNLPADYNLEMIVNHLDKKLGTPGPTFFPSPDAKQRDQNTFTQFKISGPVGPVQLTARAMYDRQESRFQDPLGWPSTSDTHKLETVGTEIQATWNKDIQNIVLGGDFYNDTLDSTANGDREQDRWALFAQYDIQPLERFQVLLSLRYDDHSDFRSAFSPRASLIFTLLENTRLRISAGKSFRAPHFNDRFWPDTGFVAGNPDLKPESAWEYEVGLEQQWHDFAGAKIAGFIRDAKDLIVWAADDPEDMFSTWRPNNVNRSRTWGAEADAWLLLHSHVRWGVNYTFLRPKDRDTGDYLKNLPHHQAGSYIEVGPFWDTKLRLAGRYARYYKDPSRKHSSYMVFDATLSRPLLVWQRLEMELQVAARNILDKDYEVINGYPMPPAEIMVSLSATF
jgi:vitamin B12 transporter